jgi:hypothetical protein
LLDQRGTSEASHRLGTGRQPFECPNVERGEEWVGDEAVEDLRTRRLHVGAVAHEEGGGEQTPWR